MNILKNKITTGITTLLLIVLTISLSSFSGNNKKSSKSDKENSRITFSEKNSNSGSETGEMPIYGNWKTFTKNDGLPSDKIYCIRVDGDRILAGTSNGLAVFENNEWKTYGVKDGLGHKGVLSIDVSEETGDVWLGTLGGLTRWSSGSFYTFTQLNSGLANNIIYSVICDGKDVWVATGGGAGHYDTFSDEWEIYMERNAPMHEPWTYGVCAGDNKIFIAAWGGGVIEFNKKTKKFRDYVDPDEQMELDVFPDDGVVHDITTGVSYANGVLWVATYFGLSWYDGAHWKSYFDHDSGLLSNFINYTKADGAVAWLCTDKGLSSFNGKTWVSYQKDENTNGGKVIITNGAKLTDGVKSTVTSAPTTIAHNFVLGVDFHDNEIWLATSKGLCKGEKIK